MGEVYLAEDTHLGREVALKRLLPIFAEDQDFVSRFKREARSISGLNHPGLVSVHSLDWVDGVLLLDMEYVRGMSLLRTLQDSVMTPAFTARIAYDVLGALAACHAHGIVHRDIKPSNILLTESLRAKLVDFGIATALADSTATQIREGRSTTVVLGTPRFMPPEAWDGGDVSPKWDLFSLGVVLYECLTGAPAFKGHTTAALAKQITNTPLTPISVRVPGISPQFATLVDRLVLINPEDRCATAEDALRMLAEAPELNLSAEEATVRRSLPKTMQRNWGQWRSAIRRWRSSLARRAALAVGLLALVSIAIIGARILPQATETAARPADPVAPAAVPANGDTFYLAKSLDAADAPAWRWWIGPAQKDNSRKIVAYYDLGWSQMTMSPSADGLVFEGNWASYASPIARGFDHGTVSGKGVWKEGRSFSVRLSFISAGQNITELRTLTGDVDPAIHTRKEFLTDFESSRLIPKLIFTDMASRNLPMAQEGQALLPANGQRIFAPVISDSDAPVIDGQLSEATWRDPVFGPKGRVGELRTKEGARLIVRRTSQGVYLAIDCPNAGEGDISATLGLMVGITVPPDWAPRAVFTISNADVREQTFYTDDEREIPPAPDWKVAASRKGTGWSLEVFASFDPRLVGPWHVNFSASRESAKGDVPIAKWGADDVKALAHGAMIYFDEER